LLALVDAGMDRQAAYKLVQRHALAAWDESRSLKEALLADDEVRQRLGPEQIEALFDPAPQLAQVDAIFRRVGLLPAGAGEESEPADGPRPAARVDALSGRS
jgi:adenylosuccinate lyase